MTPPPDQSPPGHPAPGHEPDDRPRMVVICGPTGIGKTAAAIAAARAFGGQIVGADSMQIYRHMDIGTAKPTTAERAAARHHLIDIRNPNEDFDARAYAETARKVVRDLIRQHIPPIVAGGTGLYIRALLQGIFQAPRPDPETRERLHAECRRQGAPHLHRRLAAIDPETAARLHPNDAFRIARALEVMETTGIPLSEHHRRHRFADAPFAALKIGLRMEREAMYRRIDDRVDAMIAAGLRQEVQRLLDMGFNPRLKSMQSLGYRHMLDHILKGIPLAETAETLKRDTRRYAKRQLTWFRADPEIQWFQPDAIDAILTLIHRFLERRPPETTPPPSGTAP